MGSNHPVDDLGRVLPDAGWPPGRGAVGELERVRRFLNTTNLESGADRLGSAAAARRWLGSEGHPVPRRLSAVDVERLRQLRERLRDAVSPGAAAAGAAREIDRLTASVTFRVRFEAGVHLEPAGPGVDRFLGWLLATVHEATVAGTWGRLKSCRNPHCRWVYYDHSRNAGGAWCSTDACGARLKARAYRTRQRESRP